MNKLNYLKKILGYLQNPNKESLEMSIDDCHHKGLFSLVIKGTEAGRLTRIFIAKKKIKPIAVQLHSHRYPITLTAISGNIMHYCAEWKSEGFGTVQLDKFNYKSPLNGGSGLSYVGTYNYLISQNFIPVGGSLSMSENDIHTVSCSEGSIWIVEEDRFRSDHSVVLGVPFTVDGLYNKPMQFQINDNVQLCIGKIKSIINSYESCAQN